MDKLGRLREPKTIDVILKTMSTNDLMRVHAGKAIESILLRKDYVKEIIGTEIYSALTKGVN